MATQAPTWNVLFLWLTEVYASVIWCTAASKQQRQPARWISGHSRRAPRANRGRKDLWQLLLLLLLLLVLGLGLCLRVLPSLSDFKPIRVFHPARHCSFGWGVERDNPPPSAHGGPSCRGSITVPLAGGAVQELLEVVQVRGGVWGGRGWWWQVVRRGGWLPSFVVP